MNKFFFFAPCFFNLITYSYASCGDIAKPGVEWVSCNKTARNFTGVDFNHATLNNSNFSYSYFDNANLSWANLEKTSIEYAFFSHANLSHANLLFATGHGVAFNDTNLDRTTFNFTNLPHSDFFGAQLTFTGFYEAKLQNSDFSETNLQGAWFYHADLTGSKFCFANFDFPDFKPDFNGAILRDVDFRGAKGVDFTVKSKEFEGADFSGAIIGDNKKCQEGSIGHCKI